MTKIRKKLIIIGAGLSGLYLASKLEAFFDITIVEARDRTGGRVFSLSDHDMGPSWVWQHHSNILKLIDTLDLTLFEQYTQGDALYDSKGKVERFRAQETLPSFRVEGGIIKIIKALESHLEISKIKLNTEVLSIDESKDMVKVKSMDKEFIADFVVSTLPPRLSAKLEYFPKLNNALEKGMLETPTWMGNSAKCVITFAQDIWKEKSLSGFMFSTHGPIIEMHEASTKESPALFGFLYTNADMKNLKRDITNQLIRVLGIEESDILNIYVVDWKKEKFTASQEDNQPLTSHPSYNLKIEGLGKRIFFSSTEFAQKEGGYLEGAILRANSTITALLEADI